MFAEFEREVHARVDKGEPLTGETSSPRSTARSCAATTATRRAWSRSTTSTPSSGRYIPHFYYVVLRLPVRDLDLGGLALRRGRSSRAKPGARERYLKLLAAGSSDYPYDLVKAAGVDLATSAPYTAVATSMNRIMDEIETILARRGK